MNNLTEINYDYLTQRVFSLKPTDNAGFENMALEVFRLQYLFNPLYQDFCKNLNLKPSEVRSLEEIPFLPIELFKQQAVITSLGQKKNSAIFTSSGTSETGISRHYVNDMTVYEKSFRICFAKQYGDPANYCILALLPSYLEREGSSLVYMARDLITQSHHPLSGFFLHDLPSLVETIEKLKARKTKTLLLGVSYALMDLAECDVRLNDDFIVMETGGMKGKRTELLKSELHALLKEKLNVKAIHSEYGMTELLSQAYSQKEGLFTCPAWMKILIRDTNDPFAYLAAGKTGGINVIDLANLNSCSFIATQDLGRKYDDQTFELMGRFDNGDIRGCNLMVE